MRRTVKSVKRLVLGLAAIGALSACAPVVSHRGYIPDEDKLSSISPGVDTKQTVVERLGTPSTIANFDSSVWYYVSSEEHQTAWKEPKTVERSVVAIEFDDQSKVRDVKRFSTDDSRDIRMVKRKTPTKGRELSFWEQMFGNVGRLPGSDSNEGPGR